MTYKCPHCSQPVVQEREPAYVICPTCLDAFEMPGLGNWAIGVVPLLALQHFVLFVW